MVLWPSPAAPVVCFFVTQQIGFEMLAPLTRACRAVQKCGRRFVWSDSAGIELRARREWR
jgi:hypothetical protein